MEPLFIPAVLITLMFFVSGIGKINSLDHYTSSVAKKVHLPFSLAKVVIIGVILLEIIAPIIVSIYTFSKMPLLEPFFKLSLICLIIFTILCNIFYHYPMIKKNFYAFMSNVCTIGGLMALYTCV